MPEHLDGGIHRRPPPTALQAGQLADHATEGDPSTRRAPEDRAARPAQPTDPFVSVVCTNERTTTGDAARHQAALLASPGGKVKLVSTSQLAQQGQRALHDTCDGYDLLAIGSGAAAFTAVEYAPIPILVARRCPLGMEVTDIIAVSVDGSPESSRVVELAGQLAVAHGGTVTILAVQRSDPAFERAIGASFRVLLQATGTAPRVFGEPRPREQTIPPAVTGLSASLLVLGTGGSQSERRRAAVIAGAIGCSVLAVPILSRFEYEGSAARRGRMASWTAGSGV